MFLNSYAPVENLLYVHVYLCSWAGLFQPGVWLGKIRHDVWCYQHCGYTGPPGPSSASQVYHHALRLCWDVRVTSSSCVQTKKNIKKSLRSISVDRVEPQNCVKVYLFCLVPSFLGTLIEASMIGCVGECLSLKWLWGTFKYLWNSLMICLIINFL